MNPLSTRFALVAFTVLLLSLAFPSSDAATARRGMVASVHPIATDAGVEALGAGGNAIDAAVATALMLGVVDGHNSGLGGGCFILIRLADGQLVAIDGREAAPAAAHRDLFLRDGKADPRLSQDGVLAIGVPGAGAALAHAVTRHGRLGLKRPLMKAAQVAESGFIPGASYLGRLKSTQNEIQWAPKDDPVFAEFRRIWDLPTAKPARFQQPELAALMRRMASDGMDHLYRGAYATRAVAWLEANGGLITIQDFAAYQPRLREPIRTTYRGHEIIGFPPPSSGGVHVAQILNILAHFDLRTMGEDSADFVHVVAEAMKLAFADRAHWLGDPDHVGVPRGLVSSEYARDLARLIDPRHAGLVNGHGEPPDALRDWFEREAGRHTTHFSTADDQGNWVACTATVNTSFGSKVVVPGTGLVLNNEMDDFAAQPGVPNYFGLIGAEANAVAPGKRPLSSMSPTLVLKDGKPILSVGAAGGPTIISQTLLAILRVIDFGHTPEKALEGVRFHHQWRPDRLLVERALGDGVIRELRARGHEVEVVQRLGATQAVGTDSTGQFRGAHDPRLPGRAAGP
jgi:gamma-glutamyltranspeptidase/glutathione hydrolase